MTLISVKRYDSNLKSVIKLRLQSAYKITKKLNDNESRSPLEDPACSSPVAHSRLSFASLPPSRTTTPTYPEVSHREGRGEASRLLRTRMVCEWRRLSATQRLKEQMIGRVVFIWWPLGNSDTRLEDVACRVIDRQQRRVR